MTKQLVVRPDLRASHASRLHSRISNQWQFSPKTVGGTTVGWTVAVSCLALLAAGAATNPLVGLVFGSTVAVGAMGSARALKDRAVAVRPGLMPDGETDPPPVRAYIPMWIASAWLLGTFSAFWLGGLSQRVENRTKLATFVLAATAAFAIGYSTSIRTDRRKSRCEVNSWPKKRLATKLVIIGAIYLAALGGANLVEYGAGGVNDVVSHITHPGLAYQEKFDIYAQQQATGYKSLPLQIITIFGGLYGVLAPILVVYWRVLGVGTKLAGVCGLAIYATYFLFIGTQKGLGDIIFMLVAGALVSTYGSWQRKKRSRGRKSVASVFVLGALFVMYVVAAQTQRAETFGTQETTPPNPAVAAIVGDRIATGISGALFYPTHGYLGLAYNLDTPFKWTYGYGSSPAIASYAEQYFKVPPPGTYPVRTELRTGWPAGQFWATAYPWLASDLTFPGVVIVMAGLGWLLARVWIAAAYRRDELALIVFGQLTIAIAYIPANNQLGVSRISVVEIATLLALYCARSLRKPH